MLDLLAGAHGRRWQRQYQLPRPQEKDWIADSVTAIEEVTGTRPVGYNNYWIRPGQPFATVPYTVHLNDIASFDFAGFNPAAYEQQLTDEFDQLYEEGQRRRRLMVIGLHERISGHASRVRVLDRVFARLRDREHVWWARKDQIAQWVLDHPASAMWVTRDPAPVSGLPGSSA